MSSIDPIITDAEIAGIMNWRGPGAYTAGAMRKVRALVNEVVRRERALQAQPEVAQNTGSSASGTPPFVHSPEGAAVAIEPGRPLTDRGDDMEWWLKKSDVEFEDVVRWMRRTRYQARCAK